MKILPRVDPDERICTLDGKTYVVKPPDVGCRGCAFNRDNKTDNCPRLSNQSIACMGRWRQDGRDIIWVLQKVENRSKSSH